MSTAPRIVPRPSSTIIHHPTERCVWRTRLVPIGLLFIAVPVLVMAAVLEPNRQGVGTHQKLGLPACGFYLAYRVPCITCGYTTAFCHAAHGNLAKAFAVQPAAACLAVITAAMTIIGFYSLVTGVSLAPLGRSLMCGRVLWSSFGVILGAWVYKMVTMGG